MIKEFYMMKESMTMMTTTEVTCDFLNKMVAMMGQTKCNENGTGTTVLTARMMGIKFYSSNPGMVTCK